MESDSPPPKPRRKAPPPPPTRQSLRRKSRAPSPLPPDNEEPKANTGARRKTQAVRPTPRSQSPSTRQQSVPASPPPVVPGTPPTTWEDHDLPFQPPSSPVPGEVSPLSPRPRSPPTPSWDSLPFHSELDLLPKIPPLPKADQPASRASSDPLPSTDPPTPRMQKQDSCPSQESSDPHPPCLPVVKELPCPDPQMSLDCPLTPLPQCTPDPASHPFHPCQDLISLNVLHPTTATKEVPAINRDPKEPLEPPLSAGSQPAQSRDTSSLSPPRTNSPAAHITTNSFDPLSSPAPQSSSAAGLTSLASLDLQSLSAALPTTDPYQAPQSQEGLDPAPGPNLPLHPTQQPPTPPISPLPTQSVPKPPDILVEMEATAIEITDGPNPTPSHDLIMDNLPNLPTVADSATPATSAPPISSPVAANEVSDVVTEPALMSIGDRIAFHNAAAATSKPSKTETGSPRRGGVSRSASLLARAAKFEDPAGRAPLPEPRWGSMRNTTSRNQTSSDARSEVGSRGFWRGGVYIKYPY